ncbi:hypothetical protein CTAYLR_005079 [Chrysophaeum taylorii]|uniref:RING-type domain-containing protein n=1 Tax=Chrysophaeum taylorii TaxID=2483200 RepID=A0AAD7UBY5_9STRA|nr:hypothetical protein CTAYLR_005079 [Chrysophaeum taylorii]
MIRLVVVVATAVAAAQDCCADDDDDEGIRRLELKGPSVSRQGHGTRRDDDCPCATRQQSKKNVSRTLVYSAVVVCIVAIATTAVVLARATLQYRRRGDPISENPDVEMAKGSLVSERPDAADAVCAICLDVLSGQVTRPPNCRHLFHAKCIKRWLETDATRALTCPTCAASMLPA